MSRTDFEEQYATDQSVSARMANDGVRFEVTGLPSPKGSTTRMPNGAMLQGASDSARAAQRNWAGSVAEAARDAAGPMPFTGPLHLDVTFRFPMPASRKKAVRDAGIGPKLSMPDLDKLVRSVGDALKAGGLIHDDALFVTTMAAKCEVIGWTGAVIAVRSTRWPTAAVS